MEKFVVISSIVDTRTCQSTNKKIAEFDKSDDAKEYLAQLYQKNRFNSDCNDIFFDGDKLSMTNTSTNTYSNYKIKKIITPE
jgi:hypothetical protein